MSDGNTYFNAFVDAAVGSIHEYVALTLQLKAKLKIANDLLAEKDNVSDQLEELRVEKDAVITKLTEQLAGQTEQVRLEKNAVVIDLTRQLENLRTDSNNNSISLQNELNSVRNQLNESNARLNEAKLIEESVHGMKNKIQHMDTLAKQYSDLKNKYAAVVEQHSLDKAALEKLISASEIKPSKKIINTKIKEKETRDDF
jgi:hypothetical protein